MSFKRTVENFTCEHCGTSVVGRGYTNHCPKCLWSKHVDTDPGDRLAVCGGLMRPIRVEGSTGKFIVVQRCEKCGVERRNKAAPDDDIDTLVAVAKAI